MLVILDLNFNKVLRIHKLQQSERANNLKINLQFLNEKSSVKISIVSNTY